MLFLSLHRFPASAGDFRDFSYSLISRSFFFSFPTEDLVGWKVGRSSSDLAEASEKVDCSSRDVFSTLCPARL